MQKNFVVYRSSAGSGKTFTLVKEYLKLALSDDSPHPTTYRKILAITFTNKAAAEMKLRIVEALKQLSENDPKGKSLLELIEAETGIKKEILAERAKINLNEILHNYSDFSISTIDSFTHKIVKTFAFDLKLPVNFSVETNTAEFYSKVVSALMSKIGESAELTELLVKYSQGNAEDNSNWDPEYKLQEFAGIMQKEDAEHFLNLIRAYSKEQLNAIQKDLTAFTFSFKSTVKKAGEAALKIIKEKNLKDIHFSYGKSGAYGVFVKWADFDFDKISELTGTRLIEAVNKNKWTGGKNTASENALVESIAPQLSEVSTHAVNYIIEHAPKYSLYHLLEKTIYPLILINELQQISEEFRNEEQVVFISEFNSRIAKVVTEEPAPFIYERLGERYSNFLLDEFQDTSTLQWLNLLPLLDNSLASGKFNLIVGDGKQSIYRWRNANVQQFNALPELQNPAKNDILAERQNSLLQNFRGEVLDTNYRSLKNIVEFNNDIFSFLPQTYLTEDFKSIYVSQAQELRHKEGGYVSVHYGTLEKENVEEENFKLIRSQIQNALDSNFHYGDICLIARNNKQGNICANFLSENNIPVISSDSLLLKNNLEINCVFAFLNYLNNPFDLINAATVIKYVSSEDQLPVKLKELTSGTDFYKILNSLNVDLDSNSFLQKNVFDICVEIVTALKLEEKSPQYIRFFLDEVNDYLVNKTGSVNDFIYWWGKRKEQASLIIPEGTNAVRIMTIHKAKGLEFPVVIIPFANWATYKANPGWVTLDHLDSPLPVGLFNLTQGLAEAGLEKFYEQEKNEQYLDNLNLLYVAFTRAVERLHVIAFKSKTQKGETVADWINIYLTNTIANAGEVFESGALEPKRLKEKNRVADAFDISSLHFNSNKGLIRIKGSHKLKLQDASDSYGGGTAREKGIKMHYILSEINTIPEIPSVLERMLKQGIISIEERPELEEKILQILQNESLQNYFNGTLKFKNESEIITDSGDILRPDKVIFDKDEAVVIDYKTGNPDPKKHGAQMSQYAMALQKMGHSKVKKLLVYLDENRVEEVS
jgi:ATP-dependent exoDNAse (exonuclease V) beta subunit